MRTRWTLVALLGAALAFGACGDDDDNGNGNGNGDDGATTTAETMTDEMEAPDSVTVDLEEQDGSGFNGTATLTAEGDSTMVDVELEGDETGVHPMHVHAGESCEEFEAAPAYPLENVTEGTSETTIDVSLADLLADPYVINVHKSASEISTYIACGEITEE